MIKLKAYGYFLIRHAQSEANIDERTQSHADIVLTELEWQQAQALVDRLPCIQQLMISKYICTLQTAQGIVQSNDVSPEINSYIHEFSYLSAKSVKIPTCKIAKHRLMRIGIVWITITAIKMQ